MALPIALTPKNNQQAFDIATAHLYEMKRRSTDPTGKMCLYRNEEGERCPIGAMIKEDDYDPVIDEAFVFGEITFLIANNMITVDPAINVMLLLELQKVHDDERNWYLDGFIGIGALRSVARKYNISSSILDSLNMKLEI
jgi:hypothetical protein